MSDFLKFLITPLLSQPEKLSISEAGSTLYLQVDEQDNGRVIGKHGAIIIALRTMIRTYCTLRNLPYTTLILKTE